MYNNKYSVTWVLINAKKRAFTPSDKNIVTISVNDFNAYFMSATYAMTKNKKFITNVSYSNNCITIDFETQFPLSDVKRRGNALRQFSRILAANGMQVYVQEQRLMIAA